MRGAWHRAGHRRKMATDKKTIGITKTNATALAQLVSSGHFASELDAAKFAMAHAIKNGVAPGSAWRRRASKPRWRVPLRTRPCSLIVRRPRLAS